MDLFPSGKLTAVAKFKLKQLERKAKSTESIAATKVESTELAEVIVSPKDETKMALIPVGGFSFYMVMRSPMPSILNLFRLLVIVHPSSFKMRT